MAMNDATVVLVHGAWADGSSWAKVIMALAASGVKAVAAPLPLTSFQDDVAALDRTLERAEGPVVLAGHAYAGGVIGATRSEKVKALVYVAALAPDEGETVADVFTRGTPHPQAPKLAPDAHGLMYLPEAAFAAAFAQNASKEELAVLAAVQRPISPACITVKVGAAAVEGPAVLVPRRRAGSHDCRGQSPLHGRADEGSDSVASRRSHAAGDRALDRRRHHPRGDRRDRQRLKTSLILKRKD